MLQGPIIICIYRSLVNTYDMPYHELQRGAWCGLHAINNALQNKVVKAEDAYKAAEVLERQLTPSLKKALSPHERRLADLHGNLDVTVVFKLLKTIGLKPEMVSNMSRAMRLASSCSHNYSVFILNTNGHYTAYRLKRGLWYLHDSMRTCSVGVTQYDMIRAFHKATRGNKCRFGRRLIHFFNYLSN